VKQNNIIFQQMVFNKQELPYLGKKETAKEKKEAEINH
jgi:hypothetical protein